MTDAVWSTELLGNLAAPDDGAVAIGPFGSNMKADTYVSEGVPVIRGTNLDGQPGFRGAFVFVGDDVVSRFSRCVIQPGDLVFPHRGAIGSVGIADDVPPGRWLLSTSMMKFRADPERLDSLFAFHFFRSDQGRHELLKNASQVGTPGIAQPLTSLRACEVPVPPIDEQRAIASVLGALDDKIEQNRRTAQKLEELARAIFRAWFVDFEPVKAKAAGATSFPSMPQPAFDGLPATFADSPIGPVPEGWTIRRLKEVCKVNARSLRAGAFSGEIEYVSISSVPEGRLEGVEQVNFSEAPSRARRVIRDGDTIWSCVRPNRKSYLYIYRPPANRIVSTGFAVLTPVAIGPSFLHQLVTQPEFVDYLVANATGSAYPAVRAEHFENAQICFPGKPALDAFESIGSCMRQWIGEAENESRKLAQTRDYLLPKLLSGEVRVCSPDLEAMT